MKRGALLGLTLLAALDFVGAEIAEAFHHKPPPPGQGPRPKPPPGMDRPPPPGGDQRGGRQHTSTERDDVQLLPADKSVAPSEVTITTDGDYRTVTANGIPMHAVGRFPNRGNPHAIEALSHRFQMTLSPRKTGAARQSGPAFWGVAVNGVPFEAGTGEFWRGDRRSGWNYDALGGAVPLGLDANHAHVQHNGAYHYHAAPSGLLAELGWSASAHSPLVGWAADGFPVYAVTGDAGDGPREMRSSYRLKPGSRPGGDAPTGPHDGTFTQDYEYVPGAGDLDECNGAMTRSAELPEGGYAYFITRSYPFISRCWMGTPDRSFFKGRG